MLGMEVSAHVHIDVSEPASRVSSRAWPASIHMDDIREVTGKRSRDAIELYPRLTKGLIVISAPCVDVSRLKAGRAGAEGEQRGLHTEVIRLKQELKNELPDVEIEELEKNVTTR